MGKSTSRTATILLLAAGLLFSLLLLEAALRVLAAAKIPVASELGRMDPMSVKVAPHGEHGFRQRPGAVFDYVTGKRAVANAEGYRGPVVAMARPAGTVRVVLLGESTTHGWGVSDSETIDTYLQEILHARDSTRRYEVINLAFDGYDAYQQWQRLLSDGVPRQPDVIIMNAGVNDVRTAKLQPPLGDPDPRTLIWETEMQRIRREAEVGPTLWTRLKHVLYIARLPQFVRSRKNKPRPPGPPTTAAADAPRTFPDAAANFALNAGRVADVAQRLGIPLLLSTPPSVLVDSGGPLQMDPREYWIGSDRARTQAYRDTLAGRLRDLAQARTSANQRVVYVPHQLPGRVFLDDCHLTAEGNRRMAEDFAAATLQLLSSATARQGVR